MADPAAIDGFSVASRYDSSDKEKKGRSLTNTDNSAIVLAVFFWGAGLDGREGDQADQCQSQQSEDALCEL